MRSLPTVDHTDVLPWIAAGGTLAEWRAKGGTLEDWQYGGGEAPPAVLVEEAFPTLATLYDRPELLRPPEVVVPRLAWRGRTTLVAGGDKSGKSTLWAHAAAALTRRRLFLGERLSKQGRVVWCGLEEAPGDAVMRFKMLEADPNRLRMFFAGAGGDLHDLLSTTLKTWSADLLVVDSLIEYARVVAGRPPDSGDASGWGAVVRPLVALSRRHDCAVAILHHTGWNGRVRDSTEIPAAADFLWEIQMPGKDEDPRLRRFQGRGRWPMDNWSARLEEGTYVLGGGGPLALEARILADTAANPGTKRNAQHGRLRGRKQAYLNTVKKLLAEEALTIQDDRLYLPQEDTQAAHTGSRGRVGRGVRGEAADRWSAAANSEEDV